MGQRFLLHYIHSKEGLVLIIVPLLAKHRGGATAHLAVIPSDMKVLVAYNPFKAVLRPLTMFGVIGLGNVLWHDIQAAHILGCDPGGSASWDFIS